MTVYLQYFSADVPPGRLLSGAARRAWRRASERMLRAPVAPSPEELLQGTGIPSLPALAHRLASPGRGLIAYDRLGLGRTLARLLPEQADGLFARAEVVLSGRLQVFGRLVEISRGEGGTDWQAGGAAPARPPDERRRGAPPGVAGADPKLAWAVGRGEQWVALGCGALAAPERAERYAEAFAASLHDFVSENPVGCGVQWGSPMEAALRLVCAGQAHALLAGRAPLASARYTVDLARLAVATGRFVLLHLEDACAVPNNHLVADHVGLLAAAALFPEWPEAARWRALAAAGLRREIGAQTHPDGATFEGSVPYHRLATELFTAGALLARRARAPLGPAYARRLAAMYAAARALLFADGTLPQLGDHDSGRVLAFRDRPPLDGGYLLPLGAAVLRDPALRVRPGAGDALEALLTCGPAAVEPLLAAPPGPPPRSASFPAAGFHLLRRAGAEVAVSCGRNGQQGIGGHSHNDKLAFELRLPAGLVVCDPGSPTYTGDRRLRDAFRGTRAHATAIVDGAEQAPLPPGRPFALPDAARAVALEFASSADGERFVGEHAGFARRGVVHRRELLLREGALVVVDRLLGGGTHEVELRWPFPDEQARVRALGPAERERLAQLDPGDGGLEPDHAVEVGPAAAPRALIVPARALATRLEGASYSPGYGELRPSRTAVQAGRVTCPATLRTVILAAPGRSPPPAEDA